VGVSVKSSRGVDLTSVCKCMSRARVCPRSPRSFHGLFTIKNPCTCKQYIDTQQTGTGNHTAFRELRDGCTKHRKQTSAKGGPANKDTLARAPVDTATDLGGVLY
jgi:hypothetical protein